MKGKEALLALKSKDRIHIPYGNQCRLFVVSGKARNSILGPIVTVRHGNDPATWIDQDDEFHLAHDCPSSHICSPLTTNRSFYKPPVKLQAR